jgi:phenylacetate-coenzyme A ligase PaaK-like adenylate-forming protein
LLAFECDTHASFHLATDSAIFEILDGELVITSLVAVTYPIVRLRTGLAGSMDRQACPCGEVVERFVPAAAPAVSRKPPSGARQMRIAAATAV